MVSRDLAFDEKYMLKKILGTNETVNENSQLQK